MIAAVAAVMSACDGDARRAAPSDVAEVRIGTFTGGAGGIANLLASEPLIAVGWDGRPERRLAESATPSEDGLALTVKLKPNVKFHTGEVVTAGRVRELLLKKSLMSEVRRIDVPGDLSLVIQLKRPHSIKPADLSEAPIDDDERPQLRTGPFKIVAPPPVAELEAYSEYHNGLAAVPRVKIREYPNHRMAWTAMMRGEVNFLHEVNRDSIEFIETGGHVQAYPLLRPYVIPLVFNLKHPVLRRREVRIAINEAIDRAEIVSNGMRGHGEPAEGPFWPHHWAYSHGRHSFPFNPEAARLRLDAAGLKIRSDPPRMPSRFRFRCILSSNDARFERIALIVQRQLFMIGVDMQLELVPRAAFVQRLAKTGDYDAFIFEMSTGRTLNFPYRFWHSKVDAAMAGYSTADEPLDRMKTGATDNDVRAAVSEVMRMMRADPPAAFLVTPREVRAADTAFDIPYETDRDVFGTFWEMRLRTPQTASR